MQKGNNARPAARNRRQSQDRPERPFRRATRIPGSAESSAHRASRPGANFLSPADDTHRMLYPFSQELSNAMTASHPLSIRQSNPQRAGLLALSADAARRRHCRRVAPRLAITARSNHARGHTDPSDRAAGLPLDRYPQRYHLHGGAFLHPCVAGKSPALDRTNRFISCTLCHARRPFCPGNPCCQLT